MKTVILSASDLAGGASRAASRLHRTLVDYGIDSRMLVRAKLSDDWRVVTGRHKIEKLFCKLSPVLDNFPLKLQKTTNPVLHSVSRFGCIKAKKINKYYTDVINIHWLGGGYISIEQISKITKPIVWTMHDMWAFCGAEHYAPDNANARWRQGYTKENRDIYHSGFDIDHWVWKRKKRAWKQKLHIVTPSNWLADCVRASDLMHDWPITVIPNPINTEIYKPYHKQYAREILGLSNDVNLVLFGAIGGGQDPRKGWDLLQDALITLSNTNAKVHAIVLGQSKPVNPPRIGIPIHWLGHLYDDVSLSLLYSAVDVTVVPSRQENLPQSGTEAQACGCPVVGFNTTGMADVIEHLVTGYLATAFDSSDLAEGIKWVLEEEERYSLLSKQSRKRAVSLWSPNVVIPQYVDVYKQAIESYN